MEPCPVADCSGHGTCQGGSASQAQVMGEMVAIEILGAKVPYRFQ